MKIWLLKSSFALNSSHIDTLCTLLNLEFPKLKLSKVQFVYILFCFRNTQYKFLHILRIGKLKTSKQCGVSTRICHLNGFKVRSSQRKTKNNQMDKMITRKIEKKAFCGSFSDRLRFLQIILRWSSNNILVIIRYEIWEKW